MWRGGSAINFKTTDGEEGSLITMDQATVTTIPLLRMIYENRVRNIPFNIFIRLIYDPKA